MTQTHTEHYERDDGRAIELTYAEPENAVRGGLVVLHEAEGITAGVRLLIGSLATEGWLAVAPHLKGDPEQEDILAATDIALAWLVDHGVQADLIGVVGFDLGGTAALVVAANRKLGAAVSVGGQGGSDLVASARKLSSP